ncbi:hypothetical protein BP5796_09905 [Coleophoma crateriformis]|uniref:Glycosyltransferase family 32 protein n=1 Tax=Coleophoma crateriformis TaxID=565419 RepID=A0A3D8QTQ7_9HELO|nr:hypothetical protein BP5796_09905 [Coleophoma crateriformis]
MLSTPSSEFPKLIWQTSNDKAKDKYANYTATWRDVNPTWKYEWLSDDGATEFVEAHFKHRPAILRFWHDLQVVILRADMLRYLIMLARGGVYGDIDTTNPIAIEEWIPPNLRHVEINAIVGIEYDDTTFKVFGKNISFCQWTLSAKPNHPLFETAIRRVMSNLEYISRMKRVELKDLKLSKDEVLQATGPGLYTDVVMEVLRNQVGENLQLEDFHGQKEPKVFGDILVLPVRGFASGQRHSHSKDSEYGTILVKHHFGKSWYS